LAQVAGGISQIATDDGPQFAQFLFRRFCVAELPYLRVIASRLVWNSFSVQKRLGKIEGPQKFPAKFPAKLKKNKDLQVIEWKRFLDTPK